MRSGFRLSLALTVWLAASVGAAPGAPLEAVGLFKDRALLKGPGGTVLVRVGETTPSGATLISSSAREAVVRYRGEVHTLTLSDRIGTRFKPAASNEIAITADALGQYRVRGAINAHMVSFLVDTGASVVAISSHQASALGIPYERSGETGSVVTAQGTVPSYFVFLDEVDVGGIVARNVPAAVIEGAYPVEILLGMSYLRHVGMRERDGVLTLIQKY